MIASYELRITNDEMVIDSSRERQRADHQSRDRKGAEIRARSASDEPNQFGAYRNGQTELQELPG